MVISKSKYKLFKTCPKLFWLSINKPEVVEDQQSESDIRDGIEVGSYAKKYFDNVIDVTAYKENGELDINEMIGLTNKCLMLGNVTIAEASFSVDNLFCSIDLLKPVGDEYDFYEVKATTETKPEHYIDAAFQKYVLTRRGLKIRRVYILHLNKGYIRRGDIDIQKLFTADDITIDSKFLLEEAVIKTDLELITKVINAKDEIKMELSSVCSDCPCKNYCLKDIERPCVLDVNRLKSKYDLFNSGIITFNDVLNSGIKLSQRQKFQLWVHTSNVNSMIDNEGLKEYLNAIKYPIYYLDFESIMLPIPPCDGSWPYEHIPTQYSLHIEYENGRLEHKEFLGDTIDPRRAIAESLCKNIPDNVCVIAYHKDFECGRLKELAGLFPDLSEHLLKISGNIVDLEVPFKSGYFYHKDMGGRDSIKVVLPALYPNDPELDYHALPVVHNGAEAMDIYPKMLEAYPEERKKIRDGLLKYCCLDTLAMVKVLRKLRFKIENSNDSANEAKKSNG